MINDYRDATYQDPIADAIKRANERLSGGGGSSTASAPTGTITPPSFAGSVGFKDLRGISLDEIRAMFQQGLINQADFERALAAKNYGPQRIAQEVGAYAPASPNMATGMTSTTAASVSSGGSSGGGRASSGGGGAAAGGAIAVAPARPLTPEEQLKANYDAGFLTKEQYNAAIYDMKKAAQAQALASAANAYRAQGFVVFDRAGSR